MAEQGTLIVTKYIPGKMYGFVGYSEDTSTAFFHLGDFQSPFPQEPFPPPIVGEEVRILEYHVQGDPQKLPKAKKVYRINPVRIVTGVVTVYDHSRGFGFIQGDDGEQYYLHATEILHGRLPIPGLRVKFYVGQRKKKPRACFIEVLK